MKVPLANNCVHVTSSLSGSDYLPVMIFGGAWQVPYLTFNLPGCAAYFSEDIILYLQSVSISTLHFNVWLAQRLQP